MKTLLGAAVVGVELPDPLGRYLAVVDAGHHQQRHLHLDTTAWFQPHDGVPGARRTPVPQVAPTGSDASSLRPHHVMDVVGPLIRAGRLPAPERVEVGDRLRVEGGGAAAGAGGVDGPCGL